MRSIQEHPGNVPGSPSGSPLDQPPITQPSITRGRRFICRKNLLAALLGAGIVALAWLLIGNTSPSVPRQVLSDSGGNIRVSYTVVSPGGGIESGQIRDVRAIEFHPGCIVVRRKDGDATVFFPQSTRSLTWENYGGN